MGGTWRVRTFRRDNCLHCAFTGAHQQPGGPLAAGFPAIQLARVAPSLGHSACHSSRLLGCRPSSSCRILCYPTSRLDIRCTERRCRFALLTAEHGTIGHEYQFKFSIPDRLNVIIERLLFWIRLRQITCHWFHRLGFAFAKKSHTWSSKSACPVRPVLIAKNPCFPFTRSGCLLEAEIGETNFRRILIRAAHETTLVRISTDQRGLSCR